MKRAYYGNSGLQMTLADFVLRAGTDPARWQVKPVCIGCGDDVHPYGIGVTKAQLKSQP